MDPVRLRRGIGIPLATQLRAEIHRDVAEALLVPVWTKGNHGKQAAFGRSWKPNDNMTYQDFSSIIRYYQYYHVFIKCHEISTNLPTCWNHPQIWEISGLWCPKLNPSCSSQSIQKTPLSLTPTCHTQTNMVMDVVDEKLMSWMSWMKNGWKMVNIQKSQSTFFFFTFLRYAVSIPLLSFLWFFGLPKLTHPIFGFRSFVPSKLAANVWSHDLFYPKKKYNSYPLLNIKSISIALYIHIETYPIISESQRISKHLSTGGGRSPFKLGLPCLTLVKTWE